MHEPHVSMLQPGATRTSRGCHAWPMCLLASGIPVDLLHFVNATDMTGRRYAVPRRQCQTVCVSRTCLAVCHALKDTCSFHHDVACQCHMMFWASWPQLSSGVVLCCQQVLFRSSEKALRSFVPAAGTHAPFGLQGYCLGNWGRWSECRWQHVCGHWRVFQSRSFFMFQLTGEGPYGKYGGNFKHHHKKKPA